MIRFAILCVLLLTPITARSQQTVSASVETLTLEQAIAIALEHNRLIKNETLEVEKAAERVAVARLRCLPQFELTLLQTQMFTPLQVNFPRGAFGSTVATGPIPALDVTLSQSLRPNTFFLAKAEQPLSQLHRIGLGVRLREIEQELVNSKMNAQRQSVVGQVKQSYYTLLGLESALSAVEETIKLYRELDRVVGEYVLQQVSLDTERLDVRAQLAREEYGSLTLRHALESQKEQINALLGRDIQTVFEALPIEGASDDGTLASARARALEHRPEAQEARLKLKKAELDKRIKKSESIPEVSLVAGYFGAANLKTLPRSAAGVGVVVKWEPFDWGRKRRERGEKQKAIEQAMNALREVETQVAMEVNRGFRKLEETRALLRASQLHQAAAREKLRVATVRYSQEAALSKETLQAQAAVAEANYQYQQALLAFWTARADFEKATGEM